MAREVAARSGPLPVDAFRHLWAEERERQLAEALAERREADLGERVRRVLARLRGLVPPADGRSWDEAALARLVDPEEAAVALEAYAAAFVALLPPRAGAAAVLERLSRSLRLAVVSNWPHAPTIDRYLAAHGWDRFAAVVVSARVGAIKPDVAIFRAAEAALGLGAADRGRILHVGDDPLADVAGAKAAGWLAAHLHGRPEDSPLPVGEAAEGVGADLELASLDELPLLLGA
jgi:putative hydrolase of the HAD superfamily